jgi:hypothetical protein
MKLTYRGINYFLPTLTVVPETAAVTPGTYRGIPLSIQHYRMSLSPRITLNLKYRGAHYRPATYGSGELFFALA